MRITTKIAKRVRSKANPPEPVAPAAEGCEVRKLQSQVTHLASAIRDESVRIVVAKLFADLIFLLDYLTLADEGSPGTESLLERFSMLHAVRGEASLLVDFIENHAMRCEGMDELLNETLDGCAYAIKHDMRRIFECELTENSFNQTDPKLRGSILHAQGVLINCFQQCMISLARVFDESVTGPRLFHDWQIRRDRSLVLCRDLAELIELVQDGGRQPLDTIAERLISFRQGSMQWLMYKDYHDYEALSEQIIVSIENGRTPADLLHRLECYLETLLAHVKTRAVLADPAFESSMTFDELNVSMENSLEAPAVSFA